MNKKLRVPEKGGALHNKPIRDQRNALRAKIFEHADEIFDRYVWGESFTSIAASLPFEVQGWKLRVVLLDSEETRDQFAQINLFRAHNLVDQALDYGRQAASIGDSAGLKVGIDVNLKVASKLAAAEYGDKTKMELTGKDGGPVKLLNMTDEQLLEIVSKAKEPVK